VNFRRTSTQQPPGQAEPETPPAKAGGKGRPTPKRSDAQSRRKAAVTKAPTDRKEAVRLQRAAARAARERHRQALATGDEKNYPPLHSGKERAAVRDAVDSRRSIAWTGMPVFFVLFFLLIGVTPAVPALAPPINLLVFVLFFLVMGDSVAAWRRVKRVLRERFPGGTEESANSLALYGVSRNNMRPGRRKPPPRVGRGAAT
jgi:hypothetical protein